MADIYSIIIEGGETSDYWDGTISWGGETSEANRDTKYGDPPRIFTSCAAWETGRDDVESGEDEFGRIVGPWTSPDTDIFAVSGWVANSITLECPLTLPDGVNLARHDGIFGNVTNAYSLEVDGGYGVMQSSESNLTIDGLQIHNTIASDSANACIVTDVAVTGLVFKNLILSCADTGGRGIELNNSAITVIMENLVVFCPHTQGSKEGIYLDSVSTASIFNCTVTNFNDGIERDAGDVTITNCAVFNNADDFDNAAQITILTCASDDNEGTSPQNLNENVGGEWTAAFTDYAAFDFSVKDASSLLYNNGTNAGAPSVDIAGTSRPQETTVDIGAFELVAGAVPIAIDAGDVEGLSTVAASSLNFTRSLAPEDVASQSTVAASDLNRVRPINPELVTSESTVAASSLNFLLSLVPGDVLSQSDITQPVLTPVRGVYAGDLASQAAITQPTLVPIRLIDPQDVESQSTVAQPVLTSVRLIDPQDVVCQSTVSAPTVEVVVQVKDINAGDVSCQSVITQPILTPIRLIDAGKVEPQVWQEHCLNPSFENYTGTLDDGNSDTFDDWSVLLVDDPSGDKVEAVSDSQSGSVGVKITATTKDTHCIRAGFTTLETQKGGTFRLGLWTKGDGTNSLRVQVYVGSGTGDIDVDTGVTAAVWTYKEYDLTISNNAIIRLYFYSYTASGVCYVDNVSFTQPDYISQPTLTPVRLIDAQDVECQSTVDASSLTSIRLIDAQDVASQSIVTAASVEVVGAETIDINAGDVECQSTVAQSALTPIWAISADDVSCQSTVAQSSLDAVRAISAGDVASQSTVAQSSVDRVRPINAGEVASQSTVSEASVEIVGQPIGINAEDVSCQSEVIVYGTEEVFVDDADGVFVDDFEGIFVDDYPGLTPLLTVIRWTQPVGVSSQATVDQSILDAIRLVDADDVESQSTVTAPTLDPIRFIQPQVVESLATIAGLTLVAVRSVNTDDIESQSVLGPGVLNAIYLIQGGDVESQSIVTAPNLTIVGVTAQRLNKLLTLGVSA